MTREETKKAIEVMQHFEDGGEIEVIKRSDKKAKWEKTLSPLWDWHTFDYRIKKSMKVTEEEKILLKMIGQVVKAKDSNYITIINNGNPEALKNNFFFLNVETQEWEDWSEK